MAGYIGTQAVSVNTTSATISDDLAVGDDALITGTLTTTAATVFNGGFAANAVSTITTDDNAAQLSLISTDTDASTGPRLDLYRNPSQAGTDSDNLAQLNFFGLNDASEKSQYLYLFAEMADVANGSEDVRFGFGGLVGGADSSLMTFTYGTQATGADPEMVFNDSSKDINFRVESNGNANMLFVDGGENRIGIGTNSPAQFVDIQSAATFNARLLATGNNTRAVLLNQAHTSGGADVNMVMGSFGDSSRGELSMNTNHPLRFYTNNDPNKGMELETDGDVNILDGNLIISTNGHGINFAGPTAQSGGTSQILDAYEEGTWTPVMKDSTSNQVVATSGVNGQYTKIGRLVWVSAEATRNTGSSFTGTLLLTGLPFTSANISGYTSNNGTSWFDGTGTDDVTSIHMDKNTTSASFKKVGEASGQLTSDEFQNGRPFYLSFWYMTG